MLKSASVTARVERVVIGVQLFYRWIFFSFFSRVCSVSSAIGNDELGLALAPHVVGVTQVHFRALLTQSLLKAPSVWLCISGIKDGPRRIGLGEDLEEKT